MLRRAFFGDESKPSRDSQFLDDALKGTRRYRLDILSLWLGRAAIVFALVIFSSFHTVTLFGAPWTEEPTAFILLATAPAALTMALIPGQWRHPVRWLLLWGTILFTAPEYTAAAVVTVQTWALYRSWVIEDGWRGFTRRVASIIARIRHGAGSNISNA